MGLISGLKNIFSSSYKYGASDLLSTVSKAAGVAQTFLTHPIAAVKDIEKAYSTSIKETLLQAAVGGASNALLVTAPFSGAVKAGVGKAIAATVIKAPIKTAAVSLIGAGALTSSPSLAKKSIQVVSAFPESLVKTGEAIGKTVEKGGNVLETISSKDVKNVATALGAGVLVGGAAAAVYDYAKDKIQEKPVATTQPISFTPAQGVTVKDLSTPQTSTTPVTPQTSTVSSGTSPRKRRKGARKKDLPSIRQNVRVNVINTSKSVGTSKTAKYINNRLLN